MPGGASVAGKTEAAKEIDDLGETGGKHVCVAKEAAEKGQFVGRIGEKHTPGAEARPLFCCVCGTTEVVPFQSVCSKEGFSAA